jgi:UDP-N-acetylglucosamine--N-acetylmuramyl-(pentapeptide) pyrophosphoryl-undecaprenol N-acetylglucosamine transferase
MSRLALIMAGGTGGHIFPGIAVAQELKRRGWDIVWLGTPGSMEAELVPKHGFRFEAIAARALRGKGVVNFMLMPLNLLRSFWQSLRILRRLKPDVAVGLGGYVAFPAGLMTVPVGVPLVVHEQNAIAGLTNRVLAGIADRVFTAFPNVFIKGVWSGNPLRGGFDQVAAPKERYALRTGRLRILVVGGSLGARALNEVVPDAIALLPAERRPLVLHQSGNPHIEALRNRYAHHNIEADCVPFIDDMQSAYAQADLVICRAGAMTISELAAVGVAAVLVPFPHAVDDHQTANARFLSDKGAAVLMPQSTLSAQSLSQWLLEQQRSGLLQMAENARHLAKPGAAQQLAAACEALTVKKA